jgi:hypothetical protein
MRVDATVLMGANYRRGGKDPNSESVDFEILITGRVFSHLILLSN